MNLSSKINIVWLLFAFISFIFTIYEAARGFWGPLVGFAIGVFIGAVFARRNK